MSNVMDDCECPRLKAENKLLKRELEVAHRCHMARLYGNDIALEHMDGMKVGCIVCDMIRKETTKKG